MLTKNECLKCGIAYDLGRSYCVERGCGVPLPHHENTQTAKKAVNPIYSRYASTRYRATKKQIPFDLTQELIEYILNQPCEYCGQLDNIQLDRKVGNLGYIPDNVVPACKRCNTVKSMYLSHEQMMVVAKALGWHK